MSYHEKNAWACLVSLLAVFVPYFLYVYQNPFAFFGLFVFAVIVLVGMLVVFHIVNAMVSPTIRQTGDTPLLDERDQKIETWSAKISGWVLGFMVLIWCLNAMYGIPIVASMQIAKQPGSITIDSAMNDFSIPAIQALFWVHTLFAAFVVSNLTYYSMIILGYRRLV